MAVRFYSHAANAHRVVPGPGSGHRRPSWMESSPERWRAPSAPSLEEGELAGIASLACIGLTESLHRALRETEGVRRSARPRLEEAEYAGLESLAGRIEGMLAVVGGLQRCSAVARSRTWESVDCGGLLEEISAGFRDLTSDTGALIQWSELPRLYSVRPLLMLIFQELILNAIQYRSADTPEVRIEAGRGKDLGLFAVHDNGIGIDPKYRQSVFEPFYCIDPRSWRPGLGLAAVRAAVTQLGGAIRVEGNVHHGSTFLFKIPNALAS